ncbi:MAG: hypothetical protein ACJARS_003637 [bacterium]|jgi:hypothetical protein
MFGWLFGKKAQNNDGMACVACESADVATLAPLAYRCNVCGYEGGDGYAAWQDTKTRAAYDSWKVSQLREHANAQLNEARSALVAVDGLRGPSAMSTGLHAEVAGVAISMGGGTTGQADLELAQQIEADREIALTRAAAGLHAATITLDAMVDKGVIELGAVLTDARNTPRQASALRQQIESCLQQLA